MYRIIFISIFALLIVEKTVWAESAIKTHLLMPTKRLFSHKKHNEVLESLKIQCSECHNFSIKGEISGPLARPVTENFLKAPGHICHQCHFGKVNLPRPNQCRVCHQASEILKPQDHFLNWKERHGRMAEMDRASCERCHNTAQTCNQCHSKVDLMKPKVHQANFRLFHSVNARSNPQSCVVCHRKGSFCQDCHYGKRK